MGFYLNFIAFYLVYNVLITVKNVTHPLQLLKMGFQSLRINNTKLKKLHQINVKNEKILFISKTKDSQLIKKIESIIELKIESEKIDDFENIIMSPSNFQFSLENSKNFNYINSKEFTQQDTLDKDFIIIYNNNSNLYEQRYIYSILFFYIDFEIYKKMVKDNEFIIINTKSMELFTI